MDLTAALSNHASGVLYQCLMKRHWRQVERQQTGPRTRSRDGKLKFGTVSGAVLQVLASAGNPMRFIEIHREVELLLGFPVCRGSVKQCLSDESRHRKPRFERLQRGVYRLL